MRPSANNLEGLQPPATSLQTQRFAAERLGNAASRPVSGVHIGRAGRAASAFAEARALGSGGIGLRAWEFFERLLRRRGQGRRFVPRCGDLRLARRPLLPPFFRPPQEQGTPSAAVSSPSRPLLSGFSREIVTHKTLFSLVTQTLPLRLRGMTQESALAPRSVARAEVARAEVAPLLSARLSFFAPAFALRHGLLRQPPPQSPPAFAPIGVRRLEAGRSQSSIQSETRSWRDRAPFIEALALSRPPVPQASWLGVSPSAPAPAERLPVALPTAVAALPLPSPIPPLPPPGTLLRSSVERLPEMIYGTRAFVTRPLTGSPARERVPTPAQPPSAASVSIGSPSAGSSSGTVAPEDAAPRSPSFPSVTRLLAVAAAIALVQTLPSLRSASAQSLPRVPGAAALAASLRPEERPFVRLTGRRGPVLAAAEKSEARPLLSGLTSLLSRVGSASPRRPLNDLVLEPLPLPRSRPIFSPEKTLAQGRSAAPPSRFQTPETTRSQPALTFLTNWIKSRQIAPPPPILGESERKEPEGTMASRWPLLSPQDWGLAESSRLLTQPLRLPILRAPGHRDRPIPAAAATSFAATSFAGPLVRTAVSAALLRKAVLPTGSAQAAAPASSVPGLNLGGGATARWNVPLLSSLPRASHPRFLLDGVPSAVLGEAAPREGERSSAPRARRLASSLVTNLLVKLVFALPLSLLRYAQERLPSMLPATQAARAGEGAATVTDPPQQSPLPFLPVARSPRVQPDAHAPFTEAFASASSDAARLMEDVIVTEFQPQLLGLVQSFLSDWRSAAAFDTSDPPDAVESVRNPVVLWSAPWLVPSEASRLRLPIPLRMEQGFAPRIAAEASPDVPVRVGVIESSSLAAGPHPGRPPLAPMPETATWQDVRALPLHRLPLTERDALSFAAKMSPLAPLAVLTDAPGARRVVDRDTLDKDKLERQRDWPGLRAALPAAPPALSAPSVRLPIPLRFPKPSPAVTAAFDPTRPATTVLRAGTRATVLPSPRALSMALPVPPAPPLSEGTWAIQRAASGSQSAAPSASESHQQDVNLASQEKGAAANDVHLLANEVWSLLKRRLETEAERIGRR